MPRNIISGTQLRRIVFYLVAVAFLLLLPRFLYAEKPVKRVVVLHSYHQGFKWTDDIAAGISEVSQTWPARIELIHEYMDSKRRWDKNYKMLLEGLLSYKYRNMQPDAVIVSDNLAFDYMCESGKHVFPGVPVFFCGVNYLDPQVLKDHVGFTGISEVVDIGRNIDLIMNLHPQTTEIVFVVDGTETGQIISSYLDYQRKRYANRLKIRQLTEVTFSELESELTKLPKDTVVIWSIFFRDRAGEFLEFDDGARKAAKASSVPVYCLWDFSLGYGTVGGYLTTGREQGMAVAQKVFQYFAGTPVTGIPVRYDPVVVPKFDWAVLQKFNIDPAKLPEESILAGRPPTIFEQFHKWVISGLAIISILIGINLVLSFLVSKRTSELAAARDRAEAASRAKSQFLANMSHELRTPLNGVIGFTELLMTSNLENAQALYSRNANNAALSLLGIINNILDFSKIEAGKLELEKVKTDLTLLIEQNVSIVRFAAEKKKLELLLNFTPSLPRFFFVDPVRLGQILINLLGNAVKFTENGEIEVMVEFAKTDERCGELAFSVRDTGIGISKSDLASIFREFSQADNSTTRRFGGTGLGLTIARLLVEKMGGDLMLESEQGRGSRFYFKIPVEFEMGDSLNVDDLRKLGRVLVVDDNEQNRTILRDMLQNWGINVETVAGGQAAKEFLAVGEIFDVIIMDYMMPGMNGIETIRHIRTSPVFAVAKQPVMLLCSSIDDPAVLSECSELGVASKLIKPVRANDLFNCLCRLVRQVEAETVINNKTTEKGLSQVIGHLAPEIMIVEDVAMNMMIAGELIKKLMPGTTIIEASDGRIAVQKFLKRRPDIVFMDLQMPNVDGYGAAKEIRKLEAPSGVKVPIIALTASAIKGELEKCLEAGMDDLINKPIEPFILEKVLCRFLLKPE